METISTSPHMLPGMGSSAPYLGSLGGIPGFDFVQRLFHSFGFDTSFLMTFAMGLTFITSALSLFSYAFGSLSAVIGFFSANLVSSATIHSSDVTYLYVMRWLAVNKISTDSRLFCVTSRKNPQSAIVRRYSNFPGFGEGNRRHDDEDEDDDVGDAEDDSLGPKMKFSPAPGFLYFWYNGYPIIINRKLDKDMAFFVGDMPDETMVLTTVGRSPAFLREFLSEARRDYLKAQSRKTIVYGLMPSPFSTQRTWDQGRPKPSRDISTVIMPAEEKEALLNDLKEYLNPATVRWYAQRGLPYRRGCLFYGPPGTGKTSLSLALAGELKLPLFILSLSTGSLNDEGLTMLFVGLPRRCIVLLEDIDCAGVRDNKNGDTNEDDSEDSSTGSEYDDCSDVSPTRTSHQAATSSRSSKRSGGGGEGSRSGKPLGNADIPGGKESRMPRSSVSFSGLLNAIDGVASQEGRILIMTTNHRERLDPALIRPGRVDIQIELGYAQRETTVEIFRGLYQEMVSEEADEVCRLAGMFADQVPPGQFTPAEIQGFLMSYKGKPVKALENVGAWVKLKTRKETRTTRRTKLRRRPPPIVPPSPPATAPASPTPPVTEATPERERQRLVREVSSIIEKLQHMDSVEGPNPVSESSKSEGRWMHGLEENGHKEELE